MMNVNNHQNIKDVLYKMKLKQIKLGQFHLIMIIL